MNGYLVVRILNELNNFYAMHTPFKVFLKRDDAIKFIESLPEISNEAQRICNLHIQHEIADIEVIE